MIKTIATLLIALVIAAGGVLLARYADADDAPGGVVIGWVVVLGAVVLGARAFRRRES
jgi:MYXO-CTERM domain-containing protein